MSKGGELVFSGLSNWSMIGRKTKTEKFDGVEDCQFLGFHRLRPLVNVRIKYCFSGPIAATCFALTTDGRCFCWGRNENGELGVGDFTNVYLPKELETLPPGEIVKGGACGAHHSLLFTESGKLFSTGQGSSGQLGNGKLNEYQKNYTEVSGFDSDVTDVSAGKDFSIAVTSNGTVYAFGHPQDGQLGNGSENKTLERANKMTYKFEKVPLKIEFPGDDVKIKSARCGAQHTIAMDHEGKLYSWGFGGYGRLGHKDNKNQMLPKAIEVFHEEEKVPDENLPKFMQRRVPPTRATEICCGATASFATVGEPYFALYEWGITKKSGEATMYPRLCAAVSGWKVRSFTCGYTSCMVSSERKTISWGPSPTYGELGYGENGPKSSTTSREVESLSGAIVTHVEMGLSHSMAIVDVDDVKGPKILENIPVFEGPSVAPKEGAEKKRKTPAKSAKAKKKKKAAAVEEEDAAVEEEGEPEDVAE